MEGERFRNRPTPKRVTFRVEVTEFGGVRVAEDITRWLEGLGLGQYAPAFSDNEVGFGDLRYLTDEDFTRLGLPLGGDCKPLSRLLRNPPPKRRSSSKLEASRTQPQRQRRKGPTRNDGSSQFYSVI